LVSTITEQAFEITPDLVSAMMQTTLYNENAQKYTKNHPRPYGEDVYVASESTSAVNGNMYAYFMLHTNYDESRKEKLRNIQKKNGWTPQVTVEKFSKFIGTSEPSDLKTSDFKRLINSAGKFEEPCATIIGIKKSVLVSKNTKRQPPVEELMQLMKEAEQEFEATMKSVYDPQVPRAVEAEDSPAKRQKIEEPIVSD